MAKRTVFNYVTTYNDFERRFAQFLDTAPDVRCFASLGTTEQGQSGTLFRIDYLKPSGAIGFYYPDWVAVQMTGSGEVNWIIETKGRLWEDTAAKDAAMRDWCARISQQTSSFGSMPVSIKLPLRHESQIPWRIRHRYFSRSLMALYSASSRAEVYVMRRFLNELDTPDQGAYNRVVGVLHIYEGWTGRAYTPQQR